MSICTTVCVQALESAALAAALACADILALRDRAIENVDEGNDADAIGPPLDALFLDGVLGR